MDSDIRTFKSYFVPMCFTLETYRSANIGFVWSNFRTGILQKVGLNFTKLQLQNCISN